MIVCFMEDCMKVIKKIPFPKDPVLKSSNEFGKLIAARRTALGLTQQMAAQLSNINTQTLAKIEKGNEFAGLNNALKVAADLGIKIHFTVEDENE